MATRQSFLSDVGRCDRERHTRIGGSRSHLHQGSGETGILRSAVPGSAVTTTHWFTYFILLCCDNLLCCVTVKPAVNFKDVSAMVKGLFDF